MHRIDRRALFVGAKAYEEAGGTIIRDLFDDEGGGFFADAELLNRLPAGMRRRHLALRRRRRRASAPSAPAPSRRPPRSSGTIAKNKDGAPVPPDSESGHMTAPPLKRIDRAACEHDDPIGRAARAGCRHRRFVETEQLRHQARGAGVGLGLGANPLSAVPRARARETRTRRLTRAYTRVRAIGLSSRSTP
jgi:hypothetical protein